MSPTLSSDACVLSFRVICRKDICDGLSVVLNLVVPELGRSMKHVVSGARHSSPVHRKTRPQTTPLALSARAQAARDSGTLAFLDLLRRIFEG